MFQRRFALAALLTLAASAASAETPVAVARASVEAVSPDGASLSVKTRSGEAETIHLGPKTRYILVVPATLADVKQGAFIGVAAVPGDGGALKALEVHVFPEAMRGTGEGFRKFDLAPNSSMTNGAVNARVDSADGQKLTVSYKGGQQSIVDSSGRADCQFRAGHEK